MLAVDTSRAPARPTEIRALVEAVVAAEPGDENEALEWKSTLDWSSAAAKTHIARTILGFANRMPDVAAGLFEGHAFLVIGAEAGALVGVQPVDPVDLDQWLTPYLGTQGPRWRPHFDTIAAKYVLVIEVDPPAWGHPIYAAQKEGERLPDGVVLVRGRGGTKPATGAQLAELQRRLLQAPTAERFAVSLELQSPDELTPVDLTDFDWWIEEERADLLAPLRNYSAERAEMLLAGSPLRFDWMSKVEPEERTEEAYRQQVEGYLGVCRERFPLVLAIAAASELAPMSLKVRNLTEKNLPSLAVELYIPGEVSAVEPEHGAYSEEARLPRRPRSWGPRRVNFAEMGVGFSLPHMPVLGSDYSPRPRPIIDNGGSSRIEFPSVHLRPHATDLLDEVVLLIREPPGAVLTASWSATTTGWDGKAEGEISLPVASSPWTSRDWARDEEDEAPSS